MNNRAPKLTRPCLWRFFSLLTKHSVMSYHVLLCISCASLQAVSYQLSGVYWDFTSSTFLSRSLITFSRMGSEGFSFCFGFARHCFCVRNRQQPLATVRDHYAMAVPPGSAAAVVTFLKVSIPFTFSRVFQRQLTCAATAVTGVSASCS